MKKINKQLAVLLPLAVVMDIVLLILLIALSISQTSTLAMFISPFDRFWNSNFIIDICLKNICIVLSVFSVILIVQLIVYHRLGERIGRYHKKISLCLTVAFIAAVALAIAAPASQFTYENSEFEVTVGYAQEKTAPPDSETMSLLPYYEEMAAPVGEVSGTWGNAEIYATKRDKYIGVFEDGEGDKRYIAEFFRSDSKLLREKFRAEAQFYPRADAISGETEGITYTGFYEREDFNGTPFVTFELAMESDNAICFIYLYNTEDTFNENTQALLDTALEQFRILSKK